MFLLWHALLCCRCQSAILNMTPKLKLGITHLTLPFRCSVRRGRRKDSVIGNSVDGHDEGCEQPSRHEASNDIRIIAMSIKAFQNAQHVSPKINIYFFNSPWLASLRNWEHPRWKKKVVHGLKPILWAPTCRRISGWGLPGFSTITLCKDQKIKLINEAELE